MKTRRADIASDGPVTARWKRLLLLVALAAMLLAPMLSLLFVDEDAADCAAVSPDSGDAVPCTPLKDLPGE